MSMRPKSSLSSSVSPSVQVFAATVGSGVRRTFGGPSDQPAMNRLQRVVALPRLLHAASASATRGYRRKPGPLRPAADLIKALKEKPQDVGTLVKEELKMLCNSFNQKVSGNMDDLLSRIEVVDPELGASIKIANGSKVKTGKAIKTAQSSKAKAVKAAAQPSEEDDLVDDEEPVPGLTKQHKAIAAANDAFYDAYETCDLDAMGKIWSSESYVKCSHPGRNMVSGRAEVLDSWREIFDLNDGTHPATIHFHSIKILNFDRVAIVTCLEEFDQGTQFEKMHVLSTNIYELHNRDRVTEEEEEEWRMVHRMGARVISGV